MVCGGNVFLFRLAYVDFLSYCGDGPNSSSRRWDRQHGSKGRSNCGRIGESIDSFDVDVGPLSGKDRASGLLSSLFSRLKVEWLGEVR